MLFNKTAIAFAFLAVTELVASAGTPACLLAAVNEQSNPSDLKTICGSKANDVQQYIGKICGDQTNNALSAFASACKNKGITVASASLSATGSATGSATSKPTGTGATTLMTTGAGASATGTGAQAAATSNAAGHIDIRYGAAAAVGAAVAGLVQVL